MSRQSTHHPGVTVQDPSRPPPRSLPPLHAGQPGQQDHGAVPEVSPLRDQGPVPVGCAQAQRSAGRCRGGRGPAWEAAGPGAGAPGQGDGEGLGVGALRGERCPRAVPAGPLAPRGPTPAQVQRAAALADAGNLDWKARQPLTSQGCASLPDDEALAALRAKHSLPLLPTGPFPQPRRWSAQLGRSTREAGQACQGVPCWGQH
eukprot:3565720-Rhodomonas_salina.2